MSQISAFAFGLLALLIVESPTAQTNYPQKPIRMVVGFVPGGPPDTLARILGQKFAETLGKPIVVENVPGAGGNIGTDRVAKATPDGYTLGLIGQGQLVINPSLFKLAFDPVRDLATVSQVATSPTVLVVHNTVPAKNVEELIKLAKARAGELTFASGGSGTGNHIAGELLKSVAGVEIRHIPYKGVSAAIPDVVAGRVTMIIAQTSIVLPLAREGKLRALAVTSLTRSSIAPELPTVAESGYPGFEFTNWYGLLAPANTPSAIVRAIHLHSVKVLAFPDLRLKLADLGLEVVGNSPAEFASLIKSEIPKWAKVIKEVGIKPD